MGSKTSLSVAASVVLFALACNTGPRDQGVAPEPKPALEPKPAPPAPAAVEGALRLGSPIESSVAKASLTDVAKNPAAFAGKKFATTGTVTAVCQHRGCWMEIKDDSGAAHIKMAGHGFFVPKTASGRKARVLATLVQNEAEGACGDEGMAAAGGAADDKHAKGKGCKAEAEAQLGRPLAKLELIAEGVELM
ncbi:hypothetical protein BH11MYX4_BH11MYX4_42650 [soil metagenome]